MKWSCLMGRGLRLLSEKFNFDHVNYQWNIENLLTVSDVNSLFDNKLNKRLLNDDFNEESDQGLNFF